MQPASFPGRQTVLDHFRRIIDQGRLGQSYLFVGPEGSGKEVTALEIARRVNCVAPDSCGKGTPCESCAKALSFQHPDIRWFGPAPASLNETEVGKLLAAKRENHFHQPDHAAASLITIGDTDTPGPLTMRALIRFLRRTAFQGRHKVVVVSDGQRMNAATANSFLKTLEEPSPGSLIFLLTSNRSALLPTIVSRCQQVRFEPYPAAELVDLLGERYDLMADEAGALTLLADGNARKAVALLEPEARSLQRWAGEIFAAIHERRADRLQVAADLVHEGEIPVAGTDEEGAERPETAPTLAGKRQRAIKLCEMLNLYYSEALSCRALGEDWRSRLVADADGIRQRAAVRRRRRLLADVARVEEAKSQLARNLNIGLVMAVLFRRLIDHVQQDQERLTAES